MRVDEAARLSFPDEWEARRDAERASSEELWLAQVPFLLCQDSDWAIGRDSSLSPREHFAVFAAAHKGGDAVAAAALVPATVTA